MHLFILKRKEKKKKSSQETTLTYSIFVPIPVSYFANICILLQYTDRSHRVIIAKTVFAYFLASYWYDLVQT